MATIQISVSLTDTTVGLSKSASKSLTTVGANIDYRVLSIGTSEVEVTLGTQIGNAGYAFIRNLGATNFVEVGFATTVYPLNLLAGQVALIPLAPATASLFFKSDTAANNVEVYFHES
jgi:hypothetical protein